MKYRDLLVSAARDAETDAKAYENHEHGPYTEAAASCRKRVADFLALADEIDAIERNLANTRELWRIANENAIARMAEAEKWKGIQQEACAQRDALRKTLEYASRRISEGCMSDASQAIADALGPETGDESVSGPSAAQADDILGKSHYNAR